MSEPYLALQVIMMPRDANPMPTVLPDRGPSPSISRPLPALTQATTPSFSRRS